MRLRAAALTLALSLGMIALASAQDASPPGKGSPAADAPKAAPTVNRSLARAAKKAKIEWERRTEVCIKLHGIAMAADDQELEQQVKKLEERAWALYLAATNFEPAPPTEAKKEGSK